MASRQQDYITNVRNHAKNLWAAQQFFKSFAQNEWNALDYGNTLEDGLEGNAGITRVMVGAVAFDTANAIQAVFNAGHATNLAKLL